MKTTETNPDILQALTREGVLINVSVRYWRGHKKLKAQDLGLDPDDVNDRLVSLGHKRLLQKEATAELALIEGRAHALVDSSTFPFLGGVAHFLPNAKLTEVRARLDELESEFTSAKTRFLTAYETNRLTALDEWNEMAHKLTSNPRRLLAALEAAYPEPDELEAKFGFAVRLFQIAVPDELGVELVSFGDQQNVASARRQAANEARTAIRKDSEDFVSECVTAMRRETAQLCDEMLESMRSGKTEGVHQRTLNRLTNFIDRFKEMNFADDHEMEAQLDDVRKELLSRSAAEYRESPTARRSLTKGLKQMRDHARDLTQQDAQELVERFGQMGRRRLQLAV